MSAEVDAFVDALAAGRFAVVIFMTGVGASALLREAEKRGRVDSVLAELRNATTVCRGPKPVAVLRRNNVPVSITAGEPHTTTELLQAIEGLDLKGAAVALVHYGERNDTAAAALHARGALVSEICLYEWRLPEDVAPLERIVEELIAGRIDALAVTSQIQVRHLFQIADRFALGPALTNALNTNVVVAAVGPVCDAVLRSYGVVPRVQPAHPKMGPMLLALADYFDLTR
jgi:uroporphyrinogen-III synthase